jgi:hypothetical protein
MMLTSLIRGLRLWSARSNRTRALGLAMGADLDHQQACDVSKRKYQRTHRMSSRSKIPFEQFSNALCLLRRRHTLAAQRRVLARSAMFDRRRIENEDGPAAGESFPLRATR